MRVAVYLALALAVVAGVAGRVAARWLAPRVAAIALVAAAAFSAMGWLWSLSLLAATLLHDVPRSAGALLGVRINRDPVPIWVGVVAALLLGVAVARCLGAAVREIRKQRLLRHIRLACASDNDDDLVVINDQIPRAFAVPRFARRGGQIVISSAMLRALDAEQRAVLLAHERSHLRNRHSWFRTLAALVEAAQPLLGRLKPQVDAVLERWADEDATASVPQRRAAAHSVGRAAVATQAASPGQFAPHVDQRVPDRVVALLAVAPRSSRPPVIALGALLFLMTMTIVEASFDVEHLFEAGQQRAGAAVEHAPLIYYAL